MAGQSLTQLAADSVAGAGAGQTIQLVEGLLAAYSGLLLDLERRALAGQLTTGRMAPGSVLAWVIPGNLLHALLVDRRLVRASAAPGPGTAWNAPLIGPADRWPHRRESG